MLKYTVAVIEEKPFQKLLLLKAKFNSAIEDKNPLF